VSRARVDELLAAARARVRRVSAPEAAEAMARGAVLVDTRSPDQQDRQGRIAGAVSHPLSVVLWRLDPDVPTSNEKVPLDAEVLVICREGYSSGLAAAGLAAIGFTNVADVIDGVDGWKAAGLPLSCAP
jgi:rhodanese-related sulfurtransferase